MHARLDEQAIANEAYWNFHRARIERTLEQLRRMRAKRIIELGGHPWAMTSALVASGAFELCATVSAEEVTGWPDDLPVQVRPRHLQTGNGREAHFHNYSANVERTLFDLRTEADTAIACEIVEHLIRAPHVMFLNINRWLPAGGKLLVTTPNGAQFSNPLRRSAPSAAYRSSVYSRHQHLFTLDGLCELVELCGFRVCEAGYWDVTPRRGAARLYGLFARLPAPYFRAKFQKTIFVAAEKASDVAMLPRTPRVYDPRDQWEFIAPAVKDA